MTSPHRPAYLIISVLLLLSLSANVFGAQDDSVDTKPNAETAQQRTGSTQTQVTSDQEAAPLKEQIASEPAPAELLRKESMIDAIASRPLVNGKATLAPVSPQAGSSDGWVVTFAPYVLLGSMKGEVGMGNRIAEVDARFKDIIDQFNFGFMGLFEARKGRFMILTDFIYLNLADTIETPGPLFSTIRVDLKTLTLQPALGYRLIDGDGGSIALIGGIRYWHLSTNLEFRPGLLPGSTVDVNKNWVDAIVGMSARGRLSDKWFVFGYADAGAGGSKFTYQFFAGLGVHITNRLSFAFGYRYLDVNYRKDGFVYDTALRGPVIGGGFRF